MAKLYFYYSAMNAGKSTTLLQSSYNYEERGMQTAIFCPELDNRYHKNFVTSRIGLKKQATGFAPESNLFEEIKKKATLIPKLSCILIDEAQFLTKEQVLQLVDVTLKLRLPVLCYGLRTDFLGEPFEGSKYLLALAQEIVEIKTICHCGSKATMNLRIDSSGKAVVYGNQVEIGGNERYVSMCLKHFQEALEASKSSSESLAKGIS